jgi:hypothetical protein
MDKGGLAGMIVGMVIANLLFYVGGPLLLYYLYKKGKFKNCCACKKKHSKHAIIEGDVTATVTSKSGQSVQVDNKGGTSIVQVDTTEKFNCCVACANDTCCRVYGGFVIFLWLIVVVVYIYSTAAMYSSVELSASNGNLALFEVSGGGMKITTTTDSVKKERFCGWNSVASTECPNIPGISDSFGVRLGLMGFACVLVFIPFVFMIIRTIAFEQIWTYRKTACRWTALATVPVLAVTLIPYALFVISFVADNSECALSPDGDSTTLLDFYKTYIKCNANASCAVSFSGGRSGISGGANINAFVFLYIPALYIIVSLLSIFFVCTCPRRGVKDDVTVQHVQNAVQMQVVEQTKVDTVAITAPQAAIAQTTTVVGPSSPAIAVTTATPIGPATTVSATYAQPGYGQTSPYGAPNNGGYGQY